VPGSARAIRYEFTPADPADPAEAVAQELLREYFGEVLSRRFRRPATDDEITAALTDDPNHGMTPPDGIFIVASAAGVAHGCAGLRLVDNQTGEVKRVYVRPTARGNKLGTLLMAEIETYARTRGLSSLRLDSRRDLHEARAMYTQQGYRDTPRFDGSTLAELWLEKKLEPDPRQR
jgi:GNAT superfamily N-acetyltransferase